MLCKYDVSPPALSEMGGISGRANLQTLSSSSRPGVGLLVGHQEALCAGGRKGREASGAKGGL